MATVYVSQTATNGYSVGSDANSYAAAQSKASPKLTLESALSAALSGDTIVLNDGTYTAATYFGITKPLAIAAENDYAVTLKRTGAQARVVNMVVAGSVSLGKIVVDGETNSGTNCLYVAAAASRTSLNLSGTMLKDAGSGGAWINVVATDFALVANQAIGRGSAPSGGILASLLAAGFVNINGFDVDNSSSSGASSGNKGAVCLTATAAGVEMLISGCTGVWKSGNLSNAFIRTKGLTGIIEKNRGMTINGTDTGAAIIWCENTSAAQADAITIRDNQGVNACPGQYLIIVGTDGAGAGDNMTNRPCVYRNDVMGNDAASLMHGIVLGNIKGGVVTRNRVRKSAIPLLSKLQSEAAYWIDNDVADAPTNTTGCLRSKGSVNQIFSGNRVRLRAGYLNTPVVVNQDPTLPTFSSGAQVVGNVFYSSVQVPTAASIGGSGDSSSGAFRLNAWVSSSGFAANAWQWGGVYYSTVGAWAAAHEVNARSPGSPTAADLGFWRRELLAVACEALSDSHIDLYPDVAIAISR